MNDRSYNIDMIIDEKVNLVSTLLKIASDPTRLKIMFSLIDETKCSCGHSENCCCGHCESRGCMVEKCVGDIHVEIGASQSLVSHQLKVLKDANLVAIRKKGTKVFYSLSDGHIKELLKVVLEHVMEDECHD